MIEFKCVCGQYQFSLADDLAGGLIQCPRCRRLNDVPTLSELAHLDSEGVIRFEDESNAPQFNPKRMRETARALGLNRADRDGEEIDMRATFDDMLRAGVTDVPGQLPSGKAVAPKYDPVTGELIRPVGISGEEPQRVLPVGAEGALPAEPIYDAIPVKTPRLDYSQRIVPSISIGAVFFQLLRPVNLLVMGIILIAHAFLHMCMVITMTGFFFVFVAPLGLMMAIIGHYGNVIEETGPSARDEIPTLLRNASVIDDLWLPFVHVAGGLILAYLPIFLMPFMRLPADIEHVIQIGLFVVGTFAAPALVFTLVTSGAAQNVRPDRVLGVIKTIGGKYLVIAVVYFLATAAYGAGFVLSWNGVVILLRSKQYALSLSYMAGGYGFLIAAIYLMHLCCWQLGLMYRAYHELFPWVLQRHIPTKMRERTRPRSGQLITPAQRQQRGAAPQR